jgi:hypothetical protein
MNRNQDDPVRGMPGGESDAEIDDRFPSFKLDLAFFTRPDRCPAMVRQGSRKSFELFSFLAHQFLVAFCEPVSPTHEDLCGACGLDPVAPNSRSTLSHVLQKLRDRYGVIEYERVRRRRPQIRLMSPTGETASAECRHYVYWDEPWGVATRRRFERLGARAFAAQYMYAISQYEADLARVKHHRDYWFFPLDRLSATFHVSAQFAHSGLQALVELGVMHVTPGQFQRDAPNDEFGRANRYFFQGMEGVERRQSQLKELRAKYGRSFRAALPLADALTNGRTAKNVRGLCELIKTHGCGDVRLAIQKIGELPSRSLKRRLAYVHWLLENR